MYMHIHMHYDNLEKRKDSETQYETNLELRMYIGI